MKDSTVDFLFLTFFVSIVVVAIIGAGYEIGERESVQKTEIQLMKQILVENELAWYNPTNGQFQILTNK